MADGVKSGPVSRHLGDSHETRRLRAMLAAVQEHENGLLGYLSIKADPVDGLVTILCMPRADDEAEAIDAVRKFGEEILDSQTVFALAFIQMAAETLDPDVFKGLTQAAAARLISAWEHKEATDER